MIQRVRKLTLQGVFQYQLNNLKPLVPEQIHMSAVRLLNLGMVEDAHQLVVVKVWKIYTTSFNDVRSEIVKVPRGESIPQELLDLQALNRNRKQFLLRWKKLVKYMGGADSLQRLFEANKPVFYA